MMMDALQVLVDNGIGSDALDAALESLVANDIFEDSDEKRLCIALAWYRDQGNNADPDSCESCSYDHRIVKLDGCEFLVCLDDEQADEIVKEHIEDSLWTFNPGFLASQTGIDQCVFEALADKCEGANDAVRSMINSTCDIDDFVDAATSADGRGCFLASYDGEEYDHGDAFIYRIN